MKNVYLLLPILTILMSCTFADNFLTSTISRKPQKTEIFKFQEGENIYLGVNGINISYIFEANTEEIKYSDFGHAQIITINNKNLYQVNYSDIASFMSDSKSASEDDILNAFYEWEKDFQSRRSGVVYVASKKKIIYVDSKKILLFSHTPKEKYTDPTKVRETAGCSFVYEN